MLTLIHKLRKNKAFATSELAVTVGMVVAFATGISLYANRSLKAKVANAVDYSNTNDGLGGSRTQFEPDYNSSNMKMTDNTTENLNVATDKFTYTQGGGTDGQGTKNINAVGN